MKQYTHEDIDERVVQYAADIYANDNIELSDPCEPNRFSHGEEGCWVKAWLWVPYNKIGVDPS